MSVILQRALFSKDPAPKIRFASVDPVAIRLDNPLFRFFIALGVILHSR